MDLKPFPTGSRGCAAFCLFGKRGKSILTKLRFWRSYVLLQQNILQRSIMT